MIIEFYLKLFALGYITWLFYLMGMSIQPNWYQLNSTSKALVSPVVVIFLGLNFIFNIAATALFWDLPQERGLTARLNRYLISLPLSRRGKAAKWICDHMLNPFVKGNHCIR